MKKILSLFTIVMVIISCSATSAGKQTGAKITVLQLINDTLGVCRIVDIQAKDYGVYDGSDMIGTEIIGSEIVRGRRIQIKFKAKEPLPIMRGRMILLCSGQTIELLFDKSLRDGMYHFVELPPIDFFKTQIICPLRLSKNSKSRNFISFICSRHIAESLEWKKELQKQEEDQKQEQEQNSQDYFDIL